MKNVTAIILGGGKGTRLYPLTLERAKPAVGLAGKYRLIDVPISNCINSGIKRIYVITQFMSASLHRHIMQTYNFDIFSNGFVEIIAAEQTPQRDAWFQGTADAVRASLRHTTYYKAQAILILSGDHLYRMDYNKLVEYHFNNKADITIAVYPVSAEEAPRMGLLKVDKKGRIERFAEKPKESATIAAFRAPEDLLKKSGLNPNEPRYLASMGIYLFDPDVLKSVLKDENHVDFGREIIPAALSNYKVYAFPFTSYWKDIGTIQSFFEANLALTEPDPLFKLYEPGWPIFTRARSLPPSRIIDSDIKNSLIVEGSDISGATINRSIVGLRSVINEGTLLDEVVMMGADYYEGEELLTSISEAKSNLPPPGIGPGCRIEKALIDKNARIGSDVIITRKKAADDIERENYWIRDGITIIPRGAIIKPGTKI